MLSDKELKVKYIELFRKKPEFYPSKALINLGFYRNKCTKCGRYFWSVDKKRNVCGDSNCLGGYSFIGKNLAKNKLDYIQVWEKFSTILKKKGYTPIKRYPVTARWRSDIEFVEASIDDFIPYVVKGEIEPIANPLIVPQFCLRFNDIDNIGITGAHFCNFVMIGQHAFVNAKDYNINKYFLDWYEWFDKGLKIRKEDIVFHEDIWSGSGNFGPCIEIFSGGLELANQVYMQYEQTNNGYRDLKIKVLDMGLGHERNAWFSFGKDNAYEATFPTVIKKLKGLTNLNVDNEIIKKFLPYSGILNIDEVINVEDSWNFIAKKINVDKGTLKKNILELAALYSIAEHTRALLVAISDGALPSNVGGGYNLRIILRRCLDFIEKYNWKIDLFGLCKEHAKYLKPLFPELSENLNEIKKILEIEKIKYELNKTRSKQIVSKIINEKIDENKLIELYDSQGINPELIKEEATRLNKKIDIPENFYAKISGLHKNEERKAATKKETFLDLEGIKDTELLFYENEKQTEFKAKVLKIIDNNVVLDKTCFYATSGGQLHDIGWINDQKVIEVFKQGNVIVHKLEERPVFKINNLINGKIEWNRRLQIMQHHTSTHIVNAAARIVLGKHVNQAGAYKDENKARLDITHYESLSDKEIREIERVANEIINNKVHIKKEFIERNLAEKRYGMQIYQGGAVPGKLLRIVEIKNVDVECCGGTHLDNTSEVGSIKIIKSSKISDAIVRIEFIAGGKTIEEIDKEKELIEEAGKLLNVGKNQVPERALELFGKWKLARKAVNGKEIDLEELELKSSNYSEGNDKELLEETASILKTQKEHVVKTIKRFLDELEEFKKRA